MTYIVFLGFNLNGFGYHILIALSWNTTIHAIMYFYYAIAALGPEMQKYLWWKKYLTVIQIMQFLTILFYMLYTYATGCDTPNLYDVVFGIFIFAVLILFLKFYVETYRKK